jgi:methylmalonyl-CoA/ethylmalonyl-CoA epimerase
LIIDHVGIVVRSLEDGIQQWTNLFGYKKDSEIVLNTRQKVRVVFLRKENSITIKLIEPSEPTSPISAFARKGGGLHHLCFGCEDLRDQIHILKHRGARLMVPPEPGEAFNNREIAFFLAGNLNIELIETNRDRSD